MKHVRDEDGEGVWVDRMSIDGSQLKVYVPDNEGDSEKLLADFIRQIPSIWSDLYSTMKSAFDDYGYPDDFPPEEFFLGVGRMSPDVYMGDRSSFFLRFEFDAEAFSDTIPIYDFYLDEGYRIAHHQPVF